jgi:predicted AlkP superfamily pyrophosphatase or phosphodiesterase
MTILYNGDKKRGAIMKFTTHFLLGAALLALLSSTPTPLLAKPAKQLPAPIVAPTPPKPKLIVAISVDQFSADLFAEYRGQVTGGLKRLQQGVVFPSGYQSHAATETCPGHSTILTGVHPSRSGIVANNWSDPASTRIGKDGKPDYSVYCAEDESIASSNSGNYTVSPAHLKVPTLGDRLKAASSDNRVVSVAGKDRAAVMMGGHNTDAIYYWDGKAYSTLKGRNTPPPAALARINAAATAAIAKPVMPVLPAYCAAHNIAVPIGGGKTIGTIQSRTPGNAGAFRTSPEFDQLTLALATGLLTELKLGQGKGVDILSIGLSATDYVGHTFGTEGAEMCLQIHNLDSILGTFLITLDAQKVPYVVVLTADHGGHDASERNQAHAAPDAHRIAPPTLLDIGKQVAAKNGLPENPLIGDGVFSDIYLKADVPAEKRAAVIADTKAALLQHNDVETVFTKADLAGQKVPSGQPENWSLLARAAASFDPVRSGDLLVILKPRVLPIASPLAGYVATHGSIWDYDRRVPMLFWWPGAQGFEQPLGVETVDILPTLASLIALPIPADEIDGRCLDLDSGAGTTCP